MNDTIDHPDETTLSAFLEGRLRSSEQETVEQHIQTCETCCERLAQVPPDSLSGRLKTIDASPSADLVAPERRTMDVRTDLPGGNDAGSALPPELSDHPRYQILQPLGRGGMGVVYRAEHRMMGRTVALKVIDERFINDRQAIERFRNEVKAAGRLNHPNIVRAYDAEQAGNLHFLVMEFVDGISLDELVRRRGRLAADQACSIVRKVCHGLHHASRHDMVHRDIKPQNIMVTQDGKVRILDFGLARLARANPLPTVGGHEQMHRTADALTHVGLVLGTPDYIAPEQARDAHQIDIRADLYSLGCTMYFLLTGQPPFPKGTAMQKLVAHMEQSPPPVQEVNPAVPSAVADLVVRAMQRDPAKRFQTPSEMADALEAVLSGLEAHTSTSGAAAEHTGRVAGHTSASATAEPDSTDHALQALTEATKADRRSRDRSSASPTDRTLPDRAVSGSKRRVVVAAIGIIVLLRIAAFWFLPAQHSERPATQSDVPGPAAADGGTTDPAVSNHPTVPGRAGAPGPFTEVQDLLPLVRPDEAVAGIWRQVDQTLHVNAALWARIPIDIKVPASYDLLVEFTRQDGQHSVGVVFTHGGRQATAELDAWNSFLGGIQKIDDQTLESTDNPTRRSGIQLQNGERCQLLLQVRPQSVSGVMNGQPLFHYEGDGRDFSLLEEWRLPESAQLGLIAFDSSTVFHRVELRTPPKSRP